MLFARLRCLLLRRKILIATRSHCCELLLALPCWFGDRKKKLLMKIWLFGFWMRILKEQAREHIYEMDNAKGSCRVRLKNRQVEENVAGRVASCLHICMQSTHLWRLTISLYGHDAHSENLRTSRVILFCSFLK